ncbi:hypothetical protein [Paraferrimonas haliotis]|uniref:hypothetical protein n=1 Tax=Paraferrimonas haliotis TaxID=2013866 RepID=UPI000BA99D0E|nr:hypothetical protein [Paraferrimonas haliotis]
MRSRSLLVSFLLIVSLFTQAWVSVSAAELSQIPNQQAHPCNMMQMDDDTAQQSAVHDATTKHKDCCNQSDQCDSGHCNQATDCHSNGYKVAKVMLVPFANAQLSARSTPVKASTTVLPTPPFEAAIIPPIA